MDLIAFLFYCKELCNLVFESSYINKIIIITVMLKMSNLSRGWRYMEGEGTNNINNLSAI